MTLVLIGCDSVDDRPPTGLSERASTSPRPPDSPASTSAPVDSVAPPEATCRPNTDAGTLVIWHGFGGTIAGEIFDAQIAEFNATHALQVEAVRASGYDEIVAKLLELEPDDWPDIVIAADTATRLLFDTGRFVRPSACADISALRADLLPAVDARYAVDGDLAALPYAVSTLVLFVDLAEYRLAGLDPAQPPANLDELLAASAQIVDSGASPRGLVIDDSCAIWSVLQGAAQRGEVVVTPANGHDPDASVSSMMTSPERAALLAKLRAGYVDGHLRMIGPNPTSYEDLLAVVDPVDGGTMTVHTSAALGDVIGLAAGGFPGVELSVFPLPVVGPGSLAGGNAMWIVDRPAAEADGAAFAVAQWLLDPERIATIDAATGYVPPTRSAAATAVLREAWDEHPQMRVAYDQLAAMPATAASGGALVEHDREMRQALTDACTQVVVDGADPMTTLSAADATVAASL